MSSTKFLIATVLSLIPKTVFAALSGLGNVPTVSGGGSNLRLVIINIINTVLGFLGLIAVIVIIVAVIRAGTGEGQRENARNAIVYGMIGLIVVLIASAIVTFVVSSV